LIKIELKESNNDEQTLLFSIADKGIGLIQEQQNNLFQPFSQADASTTRQFGGTGLGLAISKQITEIMNGKIWVESQKDIGSTFYFTAKFTKLPDDFEWEDKSDFNLNESEQAIESLHGSKVLLVEDNELNLELARELLVEVGITVETAVNGQEAVELLEKEKFDGILMDCQMPVMDGYEATKIIRSQSHLKDLPILAMTANAMAGDKEKVLAVGMNDHISKPIDPNVMFITMAKWIKSS